MSSGITTQLSMDQVRFKLIKERRKKEKDKKTTNTKALSTSSYVDVYSIEEALKDAIWIITTLNTDDSESNNKL